MFTGTMNENEFIPVHIEYMPLVHDAGKAFPEGSKFIKKLTIPKIILRNTVVIISYFLWNIFFVVKNMSAIRVRIIAIPASVFSKSNVPDGKYCFVVLAENTVALGRKLPMAVVDPIPRSCKLYEYVGEFSVLEAVNPFHTVATLVTYEKGNACFVVLARSLH